MLDEALLELGEVVIETTEFPDATIILPSKGKPNTDIPFSVSGKEYYPSSEYKLSPEINYKVTVSGEFIKEGKYPRDTFMENLSLNKPQGTYNVELSVWDQVERKTTVKKTIVIGDDTGSDGGGGSCSSTISPPSQRKI